MNRMPPAVRVMRQSNPKPFFCGTNASYNDIYEVRSMDTSSVVSAMSGNLHVGLAALGAAIGVGLIGMKASEAVGRNPGAATKILVQSILAIAFAEAIVFYSLFLVR